MRRTLVSCAVIALTAALLPGWSTAASAAPGGGASLDIRHVGPDYNKGRPLPLAAGARKAARRARARLQGAQAAPPAVGDIRTWLAVDDAQGAVYLKDYRLRGIGDKVEVWVAHDVDEVSRNLKFQPEDCRNGERTAITDEQVQYLIDEFDNNMYPKESQAFSVPPDRDGANAALPGLVDLPPDYYSGEGDNIVVLIDNVRDANFYDYNNSQGNTYIAGFFFSFFNELVDRNVMTIDGFDWIHRTGANPPDDPVPGDFCTSAPARPFGYEGVFAHEYQHLLEYYEDPDELSWVNEGLSDWAQTLTGYVDPSLPITDQDFDSHIQCFLGYLGVATGANPNPRRGGPENSLTAWQDQGADEILCDYGAVYSMVEYLHGLYGTDFLTALHTDDANGLASLEAQAGAEGSSAAELVHRWAAMAALDGVLDDGASLSGGAEADFQAGTLDASINWDETHAYSKLGAPPNGSDYVRLRDAEGNYLQASDIDEITFDGAPTLAPLPLQWKVDNDPPQHDTEALYSGSGPNFDRTLVRRVYVREKNPTVSFQTKWNTEETWDFGFVQISTDGGRTYKSLSNADTTSVTDPGAIPIVKQNVPGFSGNSQGWRKETFNLKKYAGQSILLSFRYVTDPGVDLPGWWIDEVKMGGKFISHGLSTAEWKTATEIRPRKVAGFTLQLLAYDDAHTQAWIAEVPLDESFAASLDAAAVTDAVGDQAETVAALVTYDEPTELITPPQYARYGLTVNGVTQPGG